jgi:hypothetical protein
MRATTATGSPIQHFGQRKVKLGLTEDITATATFQIADVRRPILSVAKAVEQGSTVVFAPGSSFLMSPKGRRVELVRKNGLYVLQAAVNHQVTIKKKDVCFAAHDEEMKGPEEPPPQPQEVPPPPQEPEKQEEEVRPEGQAKEWQDSEKAKTRKQPKGPTPEERTVHNLTHLPHQRWCEICLKGRSTEDRHLTQPKPEDPETRPQVQLDFSFCRAKEDEETLTVLSLYSPTTGSSLSAGLESKGEDPVLDKMLAQWIESEGLQKAILQADPEPATQAL